MRKLFAAFFIAILGIAYSKAQSISIDVAAVKNQSQQVHGVNLSVFYHFTENLNAGIEVNRFFEQRKTKEAGELILSSWDYDFNVHYYLHPFKFLVVYPVTGFSVSVEKESSGDETIQRKQLYFNSGAGIMLNTKTVKPHLEYVFANGNRKEHFLIAGITIELELKK